MSEKTYVFTPDANAGLTSALASALQNKGTDLGAIMSALGNKQNMFGNGWGDIIALIIVAALFGNGNFGFGGGNGNRTADTDLIMSYLQRTGTDISQLASALNCSTGQIEAAIGNVSTQLCNLGNQVGMTGTQILGAIERGNASLAQQLASCCCESRLAICNQTNTLQNSISQGVDSLRNSNSAGFSAILGKLDAMQTQSLQDKIEALREKNSVLSTQLNLEHQTATIAASQAQAVAPLNAGLAALNSEVASIKCSMPQTFPVPYQPFQAVPNCLAYQLGLYGLGVPPVAAAGTLWG